MKNISLKIQNLIKIFALIKKITVFTFYYINNTKKNSKISLKKKDITLLYSYLYFNT